MSTTPPTSHIENSLKLEAEGEVILFEIRPRTGGVLYVKTDSSEAWRNNTYEGIPCGITGEIASTEKQAEPRFSIGQPDVDLLPFKGLVNEGHLEGGTITKRIVLVSNLLANNNVSTDTVYRIKRVMEYSRSKIKLALAPWSGASRQMFPFKQYIPPDFPWVSI